MMHHRAFGRKAHHSTLLCMWTVCSLWLDPGRQIGFGENVHLPTCVCYSIARCGSPTDPISYLFISFRVFYVSPGAARPPIPYRIFYSIARCGSPTVIFSYLFISFCIFVYVSPYLRYRSTSYRIFAYLPVCSDVSLDMFSVFSYVPLLVLYVCMLCARVNSVFGDVSRFRKIYFHLCAMLSLFTYIRTYALYPSTCTTYI